MSKAYGVYSAETVDEINVRNAVLTSSTITTLYTTTLVPTSLAHPTGGTVGFFGATPAAQTSSLTSISVSVALAADTSVYGFTSVQANALLTNVNAIITALKAHGLMESP